MTPARQLIVAAIGLSGFLFLLYVDSVNSFQCKFCHASDPNCRSGEVPYHDCVNQTNCTILKIIRTDPPGVDTYRGCSDGGSDYCEEVSDNMRLCYIFCNTSGCNDEPTIY